MSAAGTLCGETDFKILETSADGIRAVRCVRRRLICLDPTPKFDAAGHHDASYYRPWLADRGRQRDVLCRKGAHFLETFARIGRLLDVGCGGGSFLLTAKERGWQVISTEVSRWAVRVLRDPQRLSILEGDLLRIVPREPPYGVVTMRHVLEHTPRPLQTLMRTRELLGPNGILIVAVPKTGFTLLRLAYPPARGKRLRYYTPGERELHLYHFTPDTLGAMLDKAGFQVVFDGIDESVPGGAKVLPQKAAKAVYTLTGRRWSEGLLVVAMKADAP
jgi:SAM-dependent methyltransferase